MGVIDELILRITADPSGLVSGLATAQGEVTGFAAEADAAGASTASLGDAAAATTANSELLGGSLASTGASAGALKGGAQDAEGATKDLGTATEDAGASAAKSGGMFGSFGTLAAAGVGIAGVAIAAFAMKSASDVGGAYKTIIAQTGATNQQLDMLKSTFNTLASQVPNSLNDIAVGESDVYDKSKQLTNGIQLTGPALDDMTEKFLNWSRISGESVKSLVDETAAWSGAYKMSASETSASMDIVETASQRTGESVGQLGSDLQRVAPQASLLGLSFAQTTAAVTGFEEAGLKVNTMQMAMSKVFQDAQKDHQNATQRWNEDTKAIQDYVQKGAGAVQGTKEWDQVTKDFSGKTLVSLITAVKEGKLSISDLNSMLANSGGAIDNTAAKTKTFSQSLTEFKQQLEVAFAPLGTSLITMLTNLLSAIQPIIPVITSLVQGFTSLPMPVQEGALALVTIVGGVKILGPLLDKLHLNLGSIMGDFEKLKSAGSGVFENIQSGNIKGALSSLTTGGTKSTCPVDSTCIDKATKSAGNLKGELGEVEDAGSGVTGELESGGVAMEGVASQGGVLGGVMDMLPGPLSGIVGSISGMGEGIGVAAAGAGEGGLLGSITGILVSIPIIGWAILAIVAAFATLAATSETFRGMLGGVLNTFQQIFGWVQQIAGALMSGNFAQAGNLLKSGFEGAINAIKNFNFGEWAAQMIQSIKESAGQIGGIILGGLSSLSDIADKITNWLNGIDWNSVIQGLITAITGMFGGGGGGSGATTSVSTGMNKSLVDGATQAAPTVLEKLVVSLGKLGVALLSILPSIGLALGEAALKGLMAINWGAAFGGAAKALASALGGAMGGAGNFLAGAIQQIPNFVNQLANQLMNGIKTFSGGLGKWFYDALITVYQFDQKLWNQMLNTVKTYMGGFGKWLYDAAVSTFNIGDKLFQAIKTGLTGFGAFLATQFDQGVNTIKTGLTSAVTTAVSMLTSGWNTAVNFVKTTLGGAVTTAVSLLTSGWTTTVNTVKTLLTGAVTTAVSTLTTGWNAIVNTVRSVLTTAVSTAVSTLTSGWTTAVNTVQSVLGSAVSTAVSSIESGFSTAVNTLRSVLTSAVSTAVSTIESGFSTAVSTIESGVSTAVSNITSGLATAASNFASGLSSAVTTGLSNLPSTVINAANGFGGALVSAVQNAAGNIASAIGGAFSSISIPISIDIPGTKIGYNGTLTLAEGAYVQHRPGGVLAVIGEGTEDEIVSPISKIGDLGALSNLKQLASGGVVSKSGNVSPLPAGPTGRSGSGNIIQWSGDYHVHINTNGTTGELNENKLIQLLLDAEIAQGLPF